MSTRQCLLSQPLGWFFLPHPQVVYRHVPMSTLLNLLFGPPQVSWVLSLGSFFLSGTVPCELWQPGLGSSAPQLQQAAELCLGPLPEQPPGHSFKAVWGQPESLPHLFTMFQWSLDFVTCCPVSWKPFFEILVRFFLFGLGCLVNLGTSGNLRHILKKHTSGVT